MMQTILYTVVDYITPLIISQFTGRKYNDVIVTAADGAYRLIAKEHFTRT